MLGVLLRTMAMSGLSRVSKTVAGDQIRSSGRKACQKGGADLRAKIAGETHDQASFDFSA